MRRCFCLAVLILLCACDPGPTAPTQDVLKDAQWWEYNYDQAVRRANRWFCNSNEKRLPGRQCEAMPENFPSLDELQERVRRIIEEIPRGQTCTSRNSVGTGGTSTFLIPADKWDSGCVPHEMLHASLYHLNHPCKRDIEHPGDGFYEDSPCFGK